MGAEHAIATLRGLCDVAENDLDTGADHYDEPVLSVAMIRAVLLIADAP